MKEIVSGCFFLNTVGIIGPKLATIDAE